MPNKNPIKGNDLADIRNFSHGLIDMPEHTKPEINQAVQAIDDWYEQGKIQIPIAIDQAVQPAVFLPEEKQALIQAWLQYKFKIGG